MNYFVITMWIAVMLMALDQHYGWSAVNYKESACTASMPLYNPPTGGDL